MELELHRLELTYQRLRRHDAGRVAQLVASICQGGQQSPVVVVEQAGQPGRYVLIDGYHRVAAMHKLGLDTVIAVVLSLDEVEALCLTHRLEGAQRRSPLEQGWLLSELVEHHGVSQEKLGQLLGHSTSWVSRRLALVHELPEQAQELVREGRLCPHGAMRHLVPLARAKLKDCERLVKGLATARCAVSGRQLGRLLMAWRSADEAERKRIALQPLLYLRAEDAAAAAPAAEEPSPERQLRSDLEAVGAICRRASRRLDDDRALADRLPMVLDRVFLQTRLAFDELEQRMEGRLNAGPLHTTGRLRPQGQGPRHQGDRAHTEGLQEHGAPDPA
jgi:ParB family chromosome partitioning protein